MEEREKGRKRKWGGYGLEEFGGASTDVSFDLEELRVGERVVGGADVVPFLRVETLDFGEGVLFDEDGASGVGSTKSLFFKLGVISEQLARENR